MNSNQNLIVEQIKRIFFQFFPISVFFYVTLTTYFPRSSYRLIKTNFLYNDKKLIIKKIEPNSKTRIRKKLLSDLKLHKTTVNWNKKNIIKLILNTEGKIIGYKPYKLLYPNYFTKLQTGKLINKNKVIRKYNRISLIIVNYN